jgi:sortase A
VSVKSGVSIIETGCWIVGIACTLIYGLSRADAELGRRLDVATVDRALNSADPNYEAWSAGRVRAYKSSLQAVTGPLLGKLSIPAVQLEVPLYGDTSELHLNRGVGLIERTATPGTGGNIGIAGHRDGFFRVLKNVRAGEEIEIRTSFALYRYRISELHVVDASDARLLSPTGEPSVTLVTCFPFYFVGNAPQRFVVRGVLISTQES